MGGCRVVVSTGCCFFRLGICNKIKKNGQNKHRCNTSNNRRTVVNISNITTTVFNFSSDRTVSSILATTGLCRQYWQHQDYVISTDNSRTMSPTLATTQLFHQYQQQQDYAINTSSNNRTMPSIPAATWLCNQYQ